MQQQYDYRVDASSSETAEQAMREIIKQVWPNDDVVRVAVPHEYWFELSSLVEKMTDREPEYASGVLILRAMPCGNKARTTGRIFADLMYWIDAGEGRGYACCGSTIITNKGEVRISGICWELQQLTGEQKSNSYAKRDMPGLWIEVCFINCKDFEEAFDKIKTHVASEITVFVAVVLLKAPTNEDLERVNRLEKAPSITTHSEARQLAAESPEAALEEFGRIVAPYVVVWELNATFQQAKYYIVNRGLHVDLQLPGVQEPFRLKLDNIINNMDFW